MNLKRVIVTGAAISAFAVGGAALAQEGAGLRGLIGEASEQTGLTPREIWRELRTGQSLAELIAANGGSVDAVIDAALAMAQQRVDRAVANGVIGEESGQAILDGLSSALEDAINRPHPTRRGLRDGAAGAVIDAVVDATGLEVTQIREASLQGTTLNELIATNGGDPAAVQQQVLDLLAERIATGVESGLITQERADALNATLQERVAEFFEESALERQFDAQSWAIMLQTAAEYTGLTVREIALEIRGGTALGDLLTTNGVDVNAYSAEATARVTRTLEARVSRGTLTQEQADALAVEFQEYLTARLSGQSRV